MNAPLETAAPQELIVSRVVHDPVAGERLLAWEERSLLVLYVVTAGLLVLAYEAPYLLALPALALLAWVPLRRLKAKAHPLVEFGLAVVGGGVAVPIGLRDKDMALGLSLFLLVIMGVRLVAPRSDRERATTAAIGVVLAAVAASEAVEPSFALLLLASMFCQLAFLHLRNLRFRGSGDARRDAESLKGPRLGARLAAPLLPPNRVFAGRAPALKRWLAWTVAFLVVLAVALAFFVSAPRLGTNLLARQRASNRSSLSGFSGRVGLDDIGKIRLNPRIAFRVEVPRKASERGVPYWRGKAFDVYWRGNWSVSPSFRSMLRSLNYSGDEGFTDPQFPAQQAADLETYRFYTEPLGTTALFSPGATDRFNFHGAQPLTVSVDPLGNYVTHEAYRVSMAYDVRVSPKPHLARHHSRLVRGHLNRACVRIPPDVDSQRLESHARELLGPTLSADADAGTNTGAVVAGLEAAIRSRYSYTLNATRTPDTEPLEDFLYHKRKGHCELFASAHVMLLRSLNIPARVVTGFYGGDYDSWSQTYTVRQSSAHAWVEALVGEDWRRYDPTPPDERASDPSTLEQLRASLTWLELRWFNNVVSFDAYDQQRYLQELNAYVEESGGLAQALGRLALWILITLLVLMRVIKAWRHRRRRAEAPPARLLPLLEALAKRGYPRRRGETLLELVRRAEPPLGLEGQLEPSVRGYYAQRFGDAPAASGELRQLARRVRATPGRSSVPAQ